MKSHKLGLVVGLVSLLTVPSFAAIDLTPVTAEFTTIATAVVAAGALAIAAAMSWKGLKIAAVAVVGFFQRMFAR